MDFCFQIFTVSSAGVAATDSLHFAYCKTHKVDRCCYLHCCVDCLSADHYYNFPWLRQYRVRLTSLSTLGRNNTEKDVWRHKRILVSNQFCERNCGRSRYIQTTDDNQQSKSRTARERRQVQLNPALVSADSAGAGCAHSNHPLQIGTGSVFQNRGDADIR